MKHYWNPDVEREIAVITATLPSHKVPHPPNASLAFPLTNPLLSRAERSDVRGPPSNCDDNVTQAAGSGVGMLCRRDCLLKVELVERVTEEQERVVWSSKNVMSYFL